jgi:tetratricopeptide (TPR) repeat protein
MKLQRVAPYILILAGGIAYHNTLAIPFLFDDLHLIENNPRLRTLWPPVAALSGTSRPVVQFSLAVNHVLGGNEVAGYHAVNIALHILVAIVLFGLLRRALGGTAVPAEPLALVIALTWEVHPLLSQSVNYVIQRGELWMSLFYVLTLYCAIRGVETGGARCWYAAAIISCALGMASKPVMVTAPIMVLLYDAIFIGRSFRSAFRQRWGLYLGLAATWLVLPLVLANAPREWKGSAGFGVTTASPWNYALTQVGAVAHYLRLAIWPVGLCFDYGWPVTTQVRTALPALMLIAAGLALTAWALVRKPTLGFWGGWFFLILAPSSSFIPIRDVAVEHRMYLPLVAVVTLLALATAGLLCRVSVLNRNRWMPGALVSATVALTLMLMTVRRNADYQTGARLWRDTVAKSPQNVRALTNLGNTIADDPDRSHDAIAVYQEALRLDPTYYLAHYNLARVLAGQGDYVAAQQHYEAAVELEPTDPKPRYNLALTLGREGRFSEAILKFAEVIRLRPEDADAQYNIGVAEEKQGKPEEAIAAYRAALKLQPQFAKAHYFLALALVRRGSETEARQHFETAAQLSSQFAARRLDFETALREHELNR